MKALFLFLLFLFSFYLFGQVTIVEEHFEKNTKLKLLENYFLPDSNLYVISKGKNLGGLIQADEYKTMYTFDINGTKNVIFDDKKFLGTKFSLGNHALMVSDISSGIFNLKPKYLIDGIYNDVPKSDMKDFYSFNGGNGNFTGKSEFFLKNNKGNFDIDFLKDDIYLTVRNLLTRKSNVFKLDKHNLGNFIGSNFIKSEEKFLFKFIVNKDETVDIDGKSITKDYTNTVFYKSRFSDQGIKIKELKFDLKIQNHVFLYSRNFGGGFTSGGYDNKFLHFGDDLSINNFLEDFKTGDFYIYGLYGDRFSKLNDMAKPKGYYIFKFDKLGNKIWESIQKIDDSNFTKDHVMTTVYVGLQNINNNSFCFSIKIGGLKDFFYYSIVDNTTGNILKSQDLKFNETFHHPNNIGLMKYGINSSLSGFKKVKFDFNSIIAINTNDKVASYIASVQFTPNLFFESSFSDFGIWLFESNDKDYFKITYFKN